MWLLQTCTPAVKGIDLMNKIIGFIGAGNMGGAIIGGITASGLCEADDIVIYDKNEAAQKLCADKYGVCTAAGACDAAARADILFFAVKPNVLYDAIAEVKDYVKDTAVIVSIAAGQSIERIEAAFDKKIKLMRVMPNTPALSGAAMSALSPNAALDADAEAKKEIAEIFSSFGRAEFVAERLMDAVTGVSGSSPAYVFMFIEALADAAVLGGMPRNQAYTFAAQSVLGSAKMVLDTGLHPAELKDMVCSPAGTTIEAVRVLEERGMRSAVIEAVTACIEKSKKL